MQATRIMPDLQTAILCEDVRQESNGNFMLIGVLSFLRVPQVPIAAFKLFVFSRWTAGVGQFGEKVRLVAPDQQTVIRQSQVKFELQDGAHTATNVTVFGQVEFRVPGVYYLEVYVEEVLKLRIPFPVVVTPPPQQNNPGPAPSVEN